MRKYLFLIFFFSSVLLMAQNAGKRIYEFLNIPVSARTAALAGANIATWDNDPWPAFENPSLLRDTMIQNTSLSYVNYFSDINYGAASYIFKIKNWGTFNAAAKFLNYGKIIMADADGVQTGKMTAGDYALVLGWGKAIDSSFSVGANLKPIFSDFFHYNSFGIAADLSATYHNKKNFAAALLIKNIGTQIKRYTKANREKMPLEVDLGLTKKWKDFPFRMYLNFNNLQQWNLLYDSLQDVDYNQTSLIDKPKKHTLGGAVDNFFRHINVGAEFAPSVNFNLRLGFNYRQRREQIVAARKGVAGFSAGIGFRISKFQLSYGLASYHLGAMSNVFSVSTKISDFYHKKN